MDLGNHRQGQLHLTGGGLELRPPVTSPYAVDASTSARSVTAAKVHPGPRPDDFGPVAKFDIKDVIVRGGDAANLILTT